MAPGIQLGEMVGRTNLSHERLARMFDFTADRRPVHRVNQRLDGAFSQADARRYICALVLMAEQLVTLGSAPFQGIAISKLRRQLPRGVEDHHRNLIEELRSRPGFTLKPERRPRTASLESAAEAETPADLSREAKALCAEAVTQLLLFTPPRT